DSPFDRPEVEKLLGGEPRPRVELLRQESDVPAVCAEVFGADGDAAEAQLAARRLEKAGENAQERRLAGAVRAEQTNDAGLQLEGDAMQRADAAAINLRHVHDGEIRWLTEVFP